MAQRKHYGIDMRGKLLVQPVATLPAWTPADERRVIYCQNDRKFYYGNDYAWIGLTGGAGVTDLWILVTNGFLAEAGHKLLVDTAGGAFSITLPAAPSQGDVVEVADGDDFRVNAMTVLRNGQKIMGLEDDMVVGVSLSFKMVFYNATKGWRII